MSAMDLLDAGAAVAWWQLGAAANIAISVAFVTITALIVVPLARTRQLRTNTLAAAAALVFFCAAVGRSLQALSALVGPSGGDSPLQFGITEPWWQAVWDLATAVAALAYLALRRKHAEVLVASPLFDDLAHREHVTRLEQLERDSAAKAGAELERDNYATMLRAIIENSLASIYVKDLQGRYLMANDLFAESMGTPKEDFLGKTDEVFDPKLAPLWREADERAMHGAYQVDEWHDSLSNERRFFESNKFPLVDATGTLYATCGISADVTEQKRANAVVAEARDAALAAAAAKSTFLATMSHEIRTPMNAVIGMTDLLLDTPIDEEQFEFLETIRTSGDSLLAVINDILDFSKIEAGDLELEVASFNLRDEVEGSLDLVVAAAAAKSVELVCLIDDDCPHEVVGDSVRLRQILGNLLSNALKFTQQGEILVAVSSVLAGEDRHQLRISVTDTGIGITAAGVGRLFKSFSQVDSSTTRLYGGTGLGLAITKRLAEAMDGGVEVTSVPGAGSTFTATIVLDRHVDSSENTLFESVAATLGGKSVLVVDDNATNRRILDLQLRGLGMICSSVPSPAAALGLAASGHTFDIAVLDMHMPLMDGVELGTELRRLPGWEVTPFLLLTSLGWRPQDLEHYFAAFLTKPVKRAALRETLAAVLTGKRLTPTRPGTVALAPQPVSVLLAEDNRVNQRVAVLILAKLGQTVDVVDNGAEAVKAVAENRYDIILMDMQMPVMDGIEATRRIRANPGLHQPHIVAMTASVLVEDREACAAAGMDSYLTKPVRVQDLREVITQLSGAVELGRMTGESAASDDGAALRAFELTPALKPLVELPAVEDSAEPHGDLDPADESPAVDPSVLESLMDEFDDVDGRMRDDLIESYLTESVAKVDELMTSALAGDAEGAAALAHSLRSSSQLLGARHLADLLDQIEHSERSAVPDLYPLALLAEIEYGRASRSLSRLTSGP